MSLYTSDILSVYSSYWLNHCGQLTLRRTSRR